MVSHIFSVSIFDFHFSRRLSSLFSSFHYAFSVVETSRRRLPKILNCSSLVRAKSMPSPWNPPQVRRRTNRARTRDTTHIIMRMQPITRNQLSIRLPLAEWQRTQIMRIRPKRTSPATRSSRMNSKTHLSILVGSLPHTTYLFSITLTFSGADKEEAKPPSEEYPQDAQNLGPKGSQIHFHLSLFFGMILIVLVEFFVAVLRLKNRCRA